jgi:hypothetical protein
MKVTIPSPPRSNRECVRGLDLHLDDWDEVDVLQALSGG